MKWYNSIFIFTLFFLLSSSLVFAGDKTKKVDGKLVCVGCNLKKSEGVQAQCSTYGHKGALLTKEGELWSFVENDHSKELMNNKTLHGKDISVSGKLVSKAKLIDVASYKVDGKNYKYCKKCSAVAPEHSH